MSDSNRTCEYVFEPTTPIVEELLEVSSITDGSAWDCPHSAEAGEEFCLFHLPVDQKDDDVVTEAILDRVQAVDSAGTDDTTSVTLEFVGARLGKFSFADRVDEFDVGDRRLTFFGATIDHATWNDLTITAGTVDFRKVSFTGLARFQHATFDCETEFGGAVFDGKANFYDSEFQGDLMFTGVDMRKGAYFREVTFGGEDADFRSSSFGDRADFSGAEGSPIFSEVSFEGGANFALVDFGGVIFDKAVFDGISYFRGAEIGSASFEWVIFKGETDFYGAEFREGAAVHFDHSTFEDGGYFKEIEHNHLLFSHADLSGSRFEDAEIPYATFDHADLTDAVFDGANLTGANLTSALLSRATLFGATLRGAFLSGTVLSDARIDDNTGFLGHHTEYSEVRPHTLAAIRSNQYCVYDPAYQEDNEHEDMDKAKNVYRALEELAGKAARPRLQSQCFVRRQDLQKHGYKQDAKDVESWQERLIASARYSRAKVARSTLLYGESPWRIIGGSVGFIFLAALLYPLGEWLRPVGGDPITYSRILAGEWSLLLESLYFSTLTFTTLGMGDYEPMGVGQVLATLNTALGAVLIALLVFVLGRRAAR